MHCAVKTGVMHRLMSAWHSIGLVAISSTVIVPYIQMGKQADQNMKLARAHAGEVLVPELAR